MRSVIRPCSKISSSIYRLLFGSVLAGLFAITHVFPVVTVAAQITAKSSSLPNSSSAMLVPHPGTGQPALAPSSHVSPAIARLLHPATARKNSLTPELGLESIFDVTPAY